MNHQRIISTQSRNFALAAVASATSLYAYSKYTSDPIYNESPEGTTAITGTEPQAPIVKKLPKTLLPQNKYPFDYPGVYVWGSNAGGVVAPGYEALISSVKVPFRIPYFDGKLLRDLKLSDNLGVAVLENGDVVQWGVDYFGPSKKLKAITDGSAASLSVDQFDLKDKNATRCVDPEVTMKGKHIGKVAISESKAVYGLNTAGTKVYAWPVSKEELQNGPKPSTERSWWKPWRLIWRGKDNVSYITLKTPPLGFREYIEDVQVGADHVLVLTTKGRVFSGSSGLYPQHQPAESKGQFGIAKFSQFNTPPEPGVLHEVKTFKTRAVAQIACGDYHSLARTLSGDVYVFGENTLGQLGLPYSYKTAITAVPTLLPLHKLYPRKINPIAVNIAAGGSTSFVSIKPELDRREFFREYPGEEADAIKRLVDQDILDEVARHVFAFGNGLKGQLGNGSFVHTQSSPASVKYFAQLKEYSEDMGKMVPIHVSNWSVGKNHVVASVGGTLDSVAASSKNANSQASSANKDVLLWGSNDFWQLGTGKRNSHSTPYRAPAIDSLSAILGKKSEPASANGDEKNSKVDYIENVDSFNNRMQLLFNKHINYKDQNGRKMSATVSQIVVAGGNNTGMFTKRV